MLFLHLYAPATGLSTHVVSVVSHIAGANLFYPVSLLRFTIPMLLLGWLGNVPTPDHDPEHPAFCRHPQSTHRAPHPLACCTFLPVLPVCPVPFPHLYPGLYASLPLPSVHIGSAACYDSPCTVTTFTRELEMHTGQRDTARAGQPTSNSCTSYHRREPGLQSTPTSLQSPCSAASMFYCLAS